MPPAVLPSAPSRPWPDRLGAGGLYLYALGSLLSPVAASLGLLTMLAVCAIRWRQFLAVYGRRHILWLIVLFMAYLAAMTLLASQEFPGSLASHQQAFGNLLMAFGPPLLVAAFCVQGDPGRIRRALLLAVAGLLALITRKQGWNILFTPSDLRLSLDMSPNGLGLIASLMLWGGLVFLVKRLARGALRGKDRIAVAGLILLTALGGLMLIRTGSRGAWVATALVIPPLLLVALWKLSPTQERARALAALLAVTIGVGGLAAWVGGPMVEHRVAATSEASWHLLEFGMDSVEDHSIGARLLMWRDAGQYIAQRPLLGWGPGSAGMLLQGSAHPEVRKYPHFHNLFLTLMVTLGGVGAGLFLCIAGSVMLEALQAYRGGRLPAELFYFAAGGFGLFFIAGMFQYRLNGVADQYLLTLLGMTALGTLAPGKPPANLDASPS